MKPDIMIFNSLIKGYFDMKEVQRAEETMKEYGVKIQYQIGTMIEVPRAAVTADEIATEAQFFSFGTNDLTQMTLGFSRDDAAKFISRAFLFFHQRRACKSDETAVWQNLLHFHIHGSVLAAVSFIYQNENISRIHRAFHQAQSCIKFVDERSHYSIALFFH